jgi:mono/diheme cytochrome c family protein
MLTALSFLCTVAARASGMLLGVKGRSGMGLRRMVKLAPLALVALVVLIQAVPYGRAHTNPPVVAEPAWDSPRTRELAVRACFDCHSHETRWPWYTNIAPFSWLAQRDVDEGREEFNLSRLPSAKALREAAETVREGEMPPWFYLPLHPDARLSAQEAQELAAGLRAMASGN